MSLIRDVENTPLLETLPLPNGAPNELRTPEIGIGDMFLRLATSLAL